MNFNEQANKLKVLKEQMAEASKANNAYLRINALLDEQSFMEIGAFVKQRPTEYDFAFADTNGEGVVTGWGTIEGSPIYVFSQNADILGGAFSEMQAKKILNILKLAAKNGSPVVGIFDSKGARIGEGVDALNGYAEILNSLTEISGVVPTVAIIAGIAGGAAAMITQSFDFVVMSKKAELYMTSPQVVKALDSKASETGTATSNATSGAAALIAEDDIQACLMAKKLISYLPSNNAGDKAYADCSDDINRTVDIENALSGENIDSYAIVSSIADNGNYLELSKDYGKGIFNGLIRLDGETIGVISNKGELSAADCFKTADFINFCDSFNIPVLTIVATNGFETSSKFENGGLIASAKMCSAYAQATVPKVTVIAGKAYGSSYIAMGSKGLGADVVLALPCAIIAPMSLEATSQILFADELKNQKNPIEKREELKERLAQTIASPYEAAKRGYVDDIINPEALRPSVIYAFGINSTKRETRLSKKHNTI